jgi:two-component system chemotaxis response regulator CheB
MNVELVVAIGASAGGVEELQKLFRDFPQTCSVAFFIVVHISASARSLLPNILGSIGNVPAEHPPDKRRIEPGRIYVAPPDHHLFVQDGVIRVDHGPRENRHRPAINPLFRSVARAFGPNAVGVLLSGMLDDGAAGLGELKAHGGTVIVQDPEETAFPDMPMNALHAVAVDFCAPVQDLRALLIRLAAPGGANYLRKLRPKPAGNKAMTATRKPASTITETNRPVSVQQMLKTIGPPSAFVCPDCKGPLWELRNGAAVHYRCLVGHDYSPNTLGAAYGEELENALWTAMRTLQERSELQNRLARQAALGKQPLRRQTFQARADLTARHIKHLKKMLEELKM